MNQLQNKMMKLLLTLLITSGVPLTVWSQYTISERANVTAKVDSSAINIRDSIKLKINTKAYYKYLRHQKVVDRNFFETKNSLYITQYAFDNWSGGGDNSFNGRVSTQTQHVYHVDKLAIDTYFNATYGIGQADKVWSKLDDVFQLNSDISYVLYNKWNYTFGINLASQFSKTYNDNEKKDMYKSRFFAPANLKPYFGFTFKVSDNQKMTLAPVSGNILMVLDDSLSNIGAFGVEKGKKAKLSVGAYFNGQWKQNITRNGALSYKTIVQSFWDYQSTPNLNWENWIDFTVFKLFTINFYVRLVYDEKIIIKKENSAGEMVDSGSHLQFKESLGFGITYGFKNKAKPTYTIIK